MTGNAELQTSAFLTDGTSDCHILKLAWFEKGGRTMCFGAVLKGAGINGRNLPSFYICITFKQKTAFLSHQTPALGVMLLGNGQLNPTAIPEQHWGSVTVGTSPLSPDVFFSCISIREKLWSAPCYK